MKGVLIKMLLSFSSISQTNYITFIVSFYFRVGALLLEMIPGSAPKELLVYEKQFVLF